MSTRSCKKERKKKKKEKKEGKKEERKKKRKRRAKTERKKWSEKNTVLQQSVYYRLDSKPNFASIHRQDETSY